MPRDDLLERVRGELYQAKVLVRQMRNSSKTIAAALQDSEERIDALIDEIEDQPDPHAQGGPGNNGSQHSRQELARQL